MKEFEYIKKSLLIIEGSIEALDGVELRTTRQVRLLNELNDIRKNLKIISKEVNSKTE